MRRAFWKFSVYFKPLLDPGGGFASETTARKFHNYKTAVTQPFRESNGYKFIAVKYNGNYPTCWVPVALRPAPIPPFSPPVLLVSLPIPPLCPPVLMVSLCPPVPLVSPPYSLACPLVPLVSLGSYSSTVAQQQFSAARGRCALSWCLLPAVRWLSSLEYSCSECVYTSCVAVAVDLV